MTARHRGSNQPGPCSKRVTYAAIGDLARVPHQLTIRVQPVDAQRGRVQLQLQRVAPGTLGRRLPGDDDLARDAAVLHGTIPAPASPVACGQVSGHSHRQHPTPNTQHPTPNTQHPTHERMHAPLAQCRSRSGRQQLVVVVQVEPFTQLVRIRRLGDGREVHFCGLLRLFLVQPRARRRRLAKSTAQEQAQHAAFQW